ncbi:MAG: serine protease [Desulfobacterota bacterium]|nr:serine protease [Thermodesulfobacteriota bacterium]
MRPNRCRAVLLWLLLIFSASPVFPRAEEKLLPLPVREIEHLLVRWLLQGGLEVHRQEREGLEIHLRGIKKEKEVLVLVLRPKSALATQVQVLRGEGEMRTSEEVLADLEAFLEGQFKEECPRASEKVSETIPQKVQQKMEALVCLGVSNGKETMQFTGFVADRKGLILSTAHDLKGISEVSVTLPDGRILRGSIKKIDPRRDLTLIDIRSKWNVSVPLSPIRRPLQHGDKIFALGCPNHTRRFLTGTIDGPMRWVNDLPLYQAEMEIQPGSSGSPVFDREGHLVGMIKGRYRGVSGIGFLIPVSTLADFMKD